MTREEQRRLKEIDMELLRVSLILDDVIRQRAALDPLGTVTFLEEMVKLLKSSIAQTVSNQAGGKGAKH